MKISPQGVSAPSAQETTFATSQYSGDSAKAARERAIAKLTGQPSAQNQVPQQNPVPNPTSISPEEMGAIAPKGQKNTNESNAEEYPNVSEAVETPKTSEEPLSAQYAQLARKEKAIRAKVQEIKAQEAALKAREAALNPPAQQQSTFDPSKYIEKDAFKQDIFGHLAELGITYDQLTQGQLEQPSPKELALAETNRKLEARLAALEEKTEKTVKSFEENQTNAYKQAISQIRRDATNLVTSDPEFETIKETGSVNDVVELIEATFKADGVLLTVDEAARAVEDHLVEEAMKIAKLKKIQSRLNPPKATEPSKESALVAGKAPQQLKTLTNAVGSTRPMTVRERAIARFKGEQFE